MPPAVWRDGQGDFGVGGLSSGGYVVTAAGADEITLERERPLLGGAAGDRAVRLVHDIGGRNAVAAFLDGDIDSTSVSIVDAPWLAYDEGLGPQLRETPSLALTYLGIDTTEPPFDDVRVRQADRRRRGLAAHRGARVARWAHAREEHGSAGHPGRR